jgi:hypothetical protein
VNAPGKLPVWITEGVYIFSRRDGDHEEQTLRMVTEILECESIRFEPNKREEMLTCINDSTPLCSTKARLSELRLFGELVCVNRKRQIWQCIAKGKKK